MTFISKCGKFPSRPLSVKVDSSPGGAPTSHERPHWGNGLLELWCPPEGFLRGPLIRNLGRTTVVQRLKGIMAFLLNGLPVDSTQESSCYLILKIDSSAEGLPFPKKDLTEK
uniref:Uncharacterized protein n=1 Tax=Steinernema glaseri TaxID=37863 RepID=A0A1I7XXF1_9BILA